MGEKVDAREFTREDRKRFRDKVFQDLAALRRMLAETAFAPEDTQAGLEIELNLVDHDLEPAMHNQRVLDAIDDEQFQTELGRFNVEINLEPRLLNQAGWASFEASVRSALDQADERAQTVGARLVTIGILPTLDEQHASAESLSQEARYALLDEQILNTRGENLIIDIQGTERLHLESDSIMPEAACTSTQVHLQVDPEEFADYWNAAQAVAGLQVAMGANSPFLFGRRLMDETRIPLFTQATDTRSEDLKAQGVRPRVWFGERWITSMFDLFEENVRLFPALIPESRQMAEEPLLTPGASPRLHELMLHNGTVWRWNRPIYDPGTDVPHLRLENRLLPAGPTPADMAANAAFFYGILHSLVFERRPLWSRMSFEQAADAFEQCARWGLEARIRWPRVTGRVRGAIDSTRVGTLVTCRDASTSVPVYQCTSVPRSYR